MMSKCKKLFFVEVQGTCGESTLVAGKDEKSVTKEINENGFGSNAMKSY